MTDVALCPLCNEPLDDGRAIQSAIDGSDAHVVCLDREESNDEGDE